MFVNTFFEYLFGFLLRSFYNCGNINILGVHYFVLSYFLENKNITLGGHCMPGKITAKQQQILDYIKEEILAKGYPPTVREICEKVGLKSTSSVHAHLNSLEDKGYIKRDATKPRAIEIVDDEFNLTRREMIHIPIVGRVAAGEPLLAVENIEDYFAIPAGFLPSGEFFILKIKGESMINVGMYENDYIIVEKTSTAKNGDIIVALIEDSVTVKRFYKENEYIRLQPENDNMDPIIVDDCIIVGKVHSLFRPMVI